MQLDDIVKELNSRPEEEKAKIKSDALKAVEDMAWLPSPGAQTDAFMSDADILLYGGQAGGGKTDLILGLAFTQHERTLIMRREHTDLGSITERAIEINGTRQGFNGSSPAKLRKKGKTGVIDFGAAKNSGDELSWAGRPHDLLAFDEAAHFLEKQVRVLIGWARSTKPGQRVRVVLGSNPPMTAEGDWLVSMFAPWLDIQHPNPAKQGELRWFVSDDEGKDIELKHKDEVVFDKKTGRQLKPMSRTFIAATVDDNPYLEGSDYKAKLDSLPEPYRSALRDGNFMIGRKDGENQCIPTSWVMDAQKRWTPQRPEGVPMCVIAADPAQGGDDHTVISSRYDGWFSPLIKVPGSKTPTGSETAGLIVANRRDGADVVVDCGGGYGGAPMMRLRDNNIIAIAYKGAESSKRRTNDKKLQFVNKRSEALWRMREALDPSQDGGSPIALPPSATLLADLTAPTFEITSRGIKVETKLDVKERLGRSPDEGDAVIMCWSEGAKTFTHFEEWQQKARAPRVMLGHESQRRRR